jgi:hypothetical protein
MAMYEAFPNALGAINRDFDGHVLKRKFLQLPMLSDQGMALKAYARTFKLRHYFCFRHLLESLGSKTFSALLARRLLFTASENKYSDLKGETFQEVECAIRLGKVTDEAKQRF